MVSENVMSGACSEFTQNAWRKDLCSNCQRSKGEHSHILGFDPLSTSSPVPVKRTSLIGDDVVNLAKRNASLILGELESKNVEPRKPRTSRSVSIEKEKFEKSTSIPNSNIRESKKIKGILVSGLSSQNKVYDIKFEESDPSIIGDDGGYDNLFLNHEEDPTEDESSEEISFTEEEREFVLQALHNTIWNSDLKNLNGLTSFPEENEKSKEFEDVKLASLWKKDRFATLRDCDKLISRRFGTFPLRKPLGSKSSLENMFDRNGKMERSSSDCDLHRIEEEGDGTHYETNFSLFEKRRSRSASEMEGQDFFQSNTSSHQDVNTPHKTNDYDSNKNGELNDDVFELNDFDAESLFDGFTTDIDFDSSSAGMALVDHLNAILARYSDNVSMKGFDDNEFLPDSDSMGGEFTSSDKILESLRIPKGSIKSKELEAKIVSLATDITRKKKKPAPRPPVAPPPKPSGRDKLGSDNSSKKSSPSHSQNLPEPSFKMVPIGKGIMGSQVEKPLSPKRTGDFHDDSSDLKAKTDNGKSKKGITSFFKSFLRRGKESPENSMEHLSENLSLPKASTASVDKNKEVSEPEQNVENKKQPQKEGNVKSPQPKTKLVPVISSRKTRTSIIMSSSETTTLFDGPLTTDNHEGSPVKMTNDVTENKRTKSIDDDKNEPKVMESGPVVKPSVPVRPKPPPNPNKPSVSPQHNQKDVRPSPKSQRKSSSDDLSKKNSERDGSSSLEREPRKSKPDTDTEKLIEDKKDAESQVVRRRAKSPKRVPAPIKPVSSAKSIENKNTSFAKELEMRLSKSLDTKINTTGAPPTKSVLETKKSAPQPPSPSAAKSEVTQSTGQTQPLPDTKEEKSDEQDPPLAEKIELPKAASRKSFLGKLGNKKSRAPPRPTSSVKRTKSISDNTGDLQVKKIDVSDISGPVLVTSMTSGISVSRRNTISLGEDCSMVSGESTSSGSTAEKYDEWPEISPLGSLENVYEPIIPKEPPPPPPTTSQNEAEPGIQNLTVTKSTSEGYLEPVSKKSAETQPLLVTDKNVAASNEQVVQELKTVSADVPAEQKGNEESLDPPISEERQKILASQPIYEEINGCGKDSPKDPLKNMTESLHVDMTESMISLDRDLAPSSPSTSFTAMSSGSEPSSACSTLSRPKPLPRKRSKRESVGFEQPYIAMNRPSITSALNESQLRDMLNQLTTMNLQALRDVYTQFERVFIKDLVNLTMSGAGPLKWIDFDIYGKPVHASDRCIVYNAKLKLNSTQCQLMLLHTKPDLMSSQHPTLLKPTVIFSDSIPFSYLMEDFIKTSQLLNNLQSNINQSNFAKCFVAVGQFDITDSLNNHMTSIRQGIGQIMLTLEDQMEHVLFYILQILSAISHCLDQGFSLGDANFRDVFLITNSNISHGNIVAFLPHQRSHDSSHAESVFCYLEKYLAENMAARSECEFGKYVGGVIKVQKMLQCHKMEILSLIRSYVEFLLWGPNETSWQGGVERQSSLEPKLSMWLERERSNMVLGYAKSPRNSDFKYSIKEFYRMKFLLKSSAVSLSECVRTHMSY